MLAAPFKPVYLSSKAADRQARTHRMAILQGQIRIAARSHVIVTPELLAGLRRGRPPYPRAPYISLAEKAIEEYFDPTLRAFCDRVLGWIKCAGLPEPGDTVLKDICRPIYRREKAKRRSKAAG
jgi:hypothetical protein